MSGIFSRGYGFGIEVGHGALRAVTVSRKGGAASVLAVDSARLAEGTVLESFTNPNIADRQSFIGALRKLSGGMGRIGRRVNVALPDFVARVVVLDFESRPAKGGDADSMIRWRLKKLMPFDMEQAALRYQYLGVFREKDAEKHRYVSAIIKSDILAQYETVFAEAGLRPGNIGISSFGLWNLYHDYVLRESSGEPFCLMYLLGGKMSVMVFEAGIIRFFRLKDLGLERPEGAQKGDDGAAYRELRASLTYYKEHISPTPVGMVFVAGDMEDNSALAAGIRERTGFTAFTLSLEKVMAPGALTLRPSDGVLYSAACAAALEY